MWLTSEMKHLRANRKLDLGFSPSGSACPATGHDLLKPVVLPLKRLQLRKLRSPHAAKLLTPLLVGSIADARSTARRFHIRSARKTDQNLTQSPQAILVKMTLRSHLSRLTANLIRVDFFVPKTPEKLGRPLQRMIAPDPA